MDYMLLLNGSYHSHFNEFLIACQVLIIMLEISHNHVL